MFWYENHEKDHISPHHRNFKWSTQTHRDVGARQIHNMSLFVVYPITNSSTQFILPFYLVAPAYLIEALRGMVTNPHYHHSCWLIALTLLTTGLVFYVEERSCSKVLFSQKQWYKQLRPWCLQVIGNKKGTLIEMGLRAMWLWKYLVSLLHIHSVVSWQRRQNDGGRVNTS